jgi:hypothetical protein
MIEILRSNFRLRFLSCFRILAFTRNPPLSEWIEVFVTSNTPVKRRGFRVFLNNLQNKLRLFED